MFGWLAQAEPIVVDSENQLLILLGLLILGAVVLLALILLMVVRRMRKTKSSDEGVQNRLEDIVQSNFDPSYDASAPPDAAVRAPPPAGSIARQSAAPPRP